MACANSSPKSGKRLVQHCQDFFLVEFYFHIVVCSSSEASFFFFFGGGVFAGGVSCILCGLLALNRLGAVDIGAAVDAFGVGLTLILGVTALGLVTLFTLPKSPMEITPPSASV